MKRYKLNFNRQIRSSGFTIFPIIVWGSFAFYLNGFSWHTLDWKAFVFTLIPLILFVSPSIYLHISYYFNDFDVLCLIDEKGQSLTISTGSNDYIYHFADIRAVERHLGIYYKNRIDNNLRRSAPWTEYGYLSLKFADGQQFQFTSLMMDIQNPPIAVTHTRFRFIPYLRVEEPISKKRRAAKTSYENEVAYFKSSFKHQTEKQLREKITNKHTYEPAAVEAARQLLEPSQEP